MKATEKQVGGDHYKKYSYQPIEFICDMNLNFIQGNIIKYIARDKGNRKEDLEKIIHYCELAQEFEVTNDHMNDNESKEWRFIRQFKNKVSDNEYSFINRVVIYTLISEWDVVIVFVKTELNKMQ